jgi:hypothetical protein
MEAEILHVLALIKEGGGLVLLAVGIFWAVPRLVGALDRNTRMIYNLAFKLNIDPDTDIVREIERTPPKGHHKI